MAQTGDRFDEDRVGLDYLIFGGASRAELEQAAALFDQNGVPHGSITESPAFGVYIAVP